MKYKSRYDVGQEVKFIFTNDALEILRTISSKTWIYDIPDVLVELIDDNFDIALKSVKYVPNIYLKLNDKFRNDRQLIKATIKSFRKHNRINEINTRIKPLKKYE
ncbi:MAG: DUF4116 domain-containing protein [Bacilli bacterium]|nr:DUF4116 domain-containing protein [Bacilli bacterium]